jgi:protein subunit release factor B
MYNTWRGPLTHEAGIHRFIRMSPHHGGLRCTTFVAVTRRRHRRPPDRIVRAYILAPYTLVKDYIVGTETEDVAAVLAGDLSTFYPEEPHA